MTVTRRELEELYEQEKAEEVRAKRGKVPSRADLELEFEADKATLEIATEAPKAKVPSRAEMEREYEKEQMEALQEQERAAQEQAADKLEWYEAGVGERTLKSLAQVGDNMMGTATGLLLDAPAGGVNAIFGTEFDPKESLGLGWVGEANHVPEGTVSRTALDLTSMTAEFALGVAPVTRIQNVSNTAAELIGFGSTVESAAAVNAARGLDAIPEMHRNLELDPNGVIDWDNPDMVRNVIDTANRETAGARLAPQMDQANAIEGEVGSVKIDVEQNVADGKISRDEGDKIIDKAEKKAAKSLAKLDAEVKQTDMGSAVEWGEEYAEGVIQTIARRYDMDVVDATAIVNKNGGITPPESFSELRQLRKADRQKEVYQTTGIASNKGDTWMGKAGTWSKWGTWLRPTTALIRENVGKGQAARVERALLRGQKKTAEMQMKYEGRNAEFQELTEWANQSRIKALFMDLKETGSAGRTALVKQARRELNAETFNTFLDMVGDSDKHQRSMTRNVWAEGEVLDQVYWGIDGVPVKPDNKTAATLNKEANAQARRPNNVTELQARQRGSAANMTEEELAQYDNPILSQYRRLTQDQDIIHLSETLGVPRGAKIGDDLQSFAKRMGDQVYADTGDINKSTAMETLSSSILTGSRARPNKWVQRYMTQSYAGTLGQIDSALLNMHDAFISAWRNGAINTGKATLRQIIGKGIDPQDFGIGDAHVGEFREGMNKLLDDPGAFDRALQNYSDFSFKWSAFKKLDMAGKGIGMGASLNQMRQFAQRGDNMATLIEKYGHLASRRELAEVSGALKKGTDIADMTARQRDIVGDMMMGKLAEQQLLTMASRPLAYLQNPALRPLWAMAGFAIKQGDILKSEIVDNIALGKYAEAGKQAALWAVWGITGYAVTDTIRDFPAYVLGVMGGGEPNEKKAPGNFGNRMIEGSLGPATLNRAGDTHTMSKLVKDPFETLGNSVLNPVSAGFLGNAAKATYSVFDPEMSTLGALSQLAPSIGRYTGEYMKSKHSADREFEKMFEFEEFEVEEFEAGGWEDKYRRGGF